MLELVRDVQAYGEELRKKRKRMKEVEARTASMVEQFRAVKSQLQRARENYLNVAGELERQKRGVSDLSNSSSGSALVPDKPTPTSTQSSSAPLQQSQSASSSMNFPLAMVPSNFVISGGSGGLQKMEKKLQQAADEYRQAIEKYNMTRQDYIELFKTSCHSFQTYEEAHVQQMLKFVGTYTQHVEQLNEARAHVRVDLRHKLDTVYTCDALIREFLELKGTGDELPELGEFIEYSPVGANDVNAIAASSNSLDGKESSSSKKNPNTLTKKVN